VHTRERGEVFEACAAELGLPDITCVHADYSGEDGARATRRLLSGPSRPTAIVYDNDVMAVAALSVTQEMGVAVPGELSIVAWDDSELCRLVHPALTAVGRQVPEFGERAAHALLELIGGADVPDILFGPPALVPRGSTTPARR
jgi:DNA-binding LacI/PurR family transcriptional regulator